MASIRTTPLAIGGRFSSLAALAAPLSLFVLLSLFVPLPLIAGAHEAPGPALAVTYVEVRAGGISYAHTQLALYASLERHAAAGLSHRGFHTAVLEELARPERWIVLEWAADQAQIAAMQSRGEAALDRLQDWLVAPLDRRVNQDFGESGSARAGRNAAGIPATALVAVTHLDVLPNQSATEAAIAPFVVAARAGVGNLRAEVWRQNGHSNHYTIVLVWAHRADRDAFAAGAAARAFRSRVAPMLGSPYDERLYQLRE